MTPRYRADQVGSLLRPRQLLDARAQHAAGRIDDAGLRTIEDAVIRDALLMQLGCGLDVLTDGEFRRHEFRSGLADAIEGIRGFVADRVWRSSAGDKSIPSYGWYVDGKLRPRRRIAEHEATFLKRSASAPLKVTLVAPGFMTERLFRSGITDKVYPTPLDLGLELASIVRQEINALFADGIQYVQLDAPGYTGLVDRSLRDSIRASGRDPESLFETMLSIDVAALQGIEKPDDACLGVHLCHGNHSSCWLSEGDYEPIAERLFGTLPVDRFLLEFDDARSGGFEPLRFVPKGKMVVLGLISTKTPELEEVDALLSRIDDASQFIDSDALAVSPQCGFASVAEGNCLSLDEQRRKLELTATVARKYWAA